MEKLKLTEGKKWIYALDLLVLGISVFAIFYFLSFRNPLVIAPQNGLVTNSSSVLFSFENADTIYIDDNMNFTSPQKIEAQDNLVINLKPGKYYWKVVGIKQSEIRELTINSVVDLKLKKNDGGYEVVNSGNTRLKVDIYDKNVLTGNVILDVDKAANVSGTAFIGGYNET